MGNRTVVKPAGKRQSTYLLPEELIRDIKITAAHQCVYPNAVVVAACREFIERHRKAFHLQEPATAAAS